MAEWERLASLALLPEAAFWCFISKRPFLYALVCTALLPRQVTVCDLGPGWTFLRWSLALAQISSYVGFGGQQKAKTQPRPRALEASALHPGPPGFVLGGGLEVWGSRLLLLRR